MDESSSSLMDEPLVGSFVRLTGAIEVEGTLSAGRIPDEDNEEVSDVIELDEDAFKADKSLCPLRDSEEAYPELVDDAAFKADKSLCPLRDSEEAYPELVDDAAVICSLKAVLKPEL